MKAKMTTKYLVILFLMFTTGMSQAAIINYQVKFEDNSVGLLTLDLDLYECSTCSEFTFSKDNGFLNAYGWKYKDTEWFVDYNDPAGSTALSRGAYPWVKLSPSLYFSWATKTSDTGLYISSLNLEVFPSLDSSLYHAFRGNYFYEPYLPEGAARLDQAVHVYRNYSSINEIPQRVVGVSEPSSIALVLLGLAGLGFFSRKKVADSFVVVQ